jgi:hypothetical protein
MRPSRTARWQVFGLAGTAPHGRLLLAVASQAQGPVLVAPRVIARPGRLSFPLTAAGQSRNLTGFPLASANLDGPQNQLQAPLYVGNQATPSTTCRAGVSRAFRAARRT